MELFFRKYFWVVNLLFLAAAAFFSARIADAIIEQKLRPPVSSLLTQEKVQASAVAQKKGVSAEALSKLTGIELPKEVPPAPEVDESAQGGQDAAEDPNPQAGSGDSEEEDAGLERSSLRAKLLGTTLANVPEWSLASLLNMEENNTSTYMIGDKILGAEIVAIRLRRVIVINEGRREYIDAKEPGAGGGAPKMAAPAPKKNAPQEESGIRATSANTYEVPKDELQKALDNMQSLATQARIVPSFKNGESQGFKIFSIKPNSLFTKLGIQNGDIIKRVNGFDINSPDKALEIYSKLQSSNRIEIEFDRGGTQTRKTYNIR